MHSRYRIRRGGSWGVACAVLAAAVGCFDAGDAGSPHSSPPALRGTGGDAAPAVSAGPIVRPVVGVALHGRNGRFEVARVRRSGPAALRFDFGQGEGEWPLAGDWDGDGFDTLGVFRPGTSAFHLRNALGPGPEDRRVAFGDPLWAPIPLVGDWNGDGIDTSGLYVRADSSFRLTDAQITHPPDHHFVFGPPRSDWIPIAGDWDGDGRDGIGLYEPDRGVFHLTSRFDGGVAEVAFAFGSPASGMRPVAGDWQGLGHDRVGLFDPATGEFRLRYELAAGPADEHFRIETELESPRPLTGRWPTPTTLPPAD